MGWGSWFFSSFDLPADNVIIITTHGEILNILNPLCRSFDGGWNSPSPIADTREDQRKLRLIADVVYPCSRAYFSAKKKKDKETKKKANLHSTRARLARLLKPAGGGAHMCFHFEWPLRQCKSKLHFEIPNSRFPHIFWNRDPSTLFAI